MISDVSSFFTHSVMSGSNWRSLELAVSRLLQHCGWYDVQCIGKSGDKGADVLAVRMSAGKRMSYLIQVKAVSSAKYVGCDAINQALSAQGFYRANVVVVATNGDFTRTAYKRRDELLKSGFDVRLWNGRFLLDLAKKMPAYSITRRELRPEYQSGIVRSVAESFEAGNRRSLFIVATGLGKTVIASYLADYFIKKGARRILVLCHATDLAMQLQQAFWQQLPKEVPTHFFSDGEPPHANEGIVFGLYQTLYGYLGGLDRDTYDIVIVDEAHHALANAFSTCIEYLTPRFLLGMTATPWRGDGAAIESIFGEPIARVSLVDGMKMGYLARVDYRLMCDNIDWERVHSLTKASLSIRDLNRRLFLPQRDEAVISELQRVVRELPEPRIAVFSPSVAHANKFASMLSAAGIPAANMSTNDKLVRRRVLLSFSTGELKAVTAVDVLNEGIDIPDINVLVFLRATHSRRIFVQQLGRGLRISPGKEKVIVLDFVTDIRRIAAVIELDREARGRSSYNGPQNVYLDSGVVTFSDNKIQGFVEAWLNDVADLQDEDEAERLAFPDPNLIYEL